MTDRPIENDNSFDVSKSEYFNSLPPFVQETLIQSAGKISGDKELENMAKKIMSDF
jgi:hypothetical protein